jgi:hypothetical protein
MASSDRRIEPSVAELIDRLTIDQIKEVLAGAPAASFAGEMRRIEQDLDTIFADTEVRLDAQMILLVIALAQINLHIWHTKDVMQTVPSRFQECMKLAHQLNGLRNQLKNRIEELYGSGGSVKSNTATEDLEGWNLSVLQRFKQ